MLSFRALSEKKTKVKINPKQTDITEMEKNHGEDCDCMKCERKRRKGEKEPEVATESAVPGKPAERLGAVTAIPQSERDAAAERLKAKAAAKRAEREKLKGSMKEGYYDPMEDPEFDHDEAERTRGQSGKPAKKKTKKSTKKEDVAYVSQEEVSEESNQESTETETFLTFGQFCEGMSMKDFKANRQKNKRKEASADAEKRGHVGKEWHNTGRKYSPDEAKSRRAKMSDDDRRNRYGSAEDPDSEDYSHYPASKTKDPKKQRKQAAMGEEVKIEEGRAEDAKASLEKVKARQKVLDAHEKKTGKKLDITKTPEHKAHKQNFPGSRQPKKVKGAKETPLETHNRRVNKTVDRIVKKGYTSKEKKEVQSMAKHTSARD